jgi:hypothetical protein
MVPNSLEMKLTITGIGFNERRKIFKQEINQYRSSGCKKKNEKNLSL